MILFPEKEPDTKHICYRGGFPLFTGDVQDGLCEVLWSNPPKCMEGKLACMCNFYDTMKPVIVEADGVCVQDIIKRVQGYKQPHGLDEAAIKYLRQYDKDNDGEEPCATEVFKAGVKFQAEQGYSREVEVKEDAGGYPYINEIELYDYDNDKPLAKKGDKVIVQIRKA